MKKLILQTLQTYLIGAVMLGAPLFLPAWTFNYWQAWVFIVVFMTSVTIIGLYLSLKDPALLERRKNFGPAKEERTSQKVIMSLAVIVNLAVLVVSALDHRFGWSYVPTWVSLVGDVLVALGLMINLLVFKENSYGASNIQVEKEQTVISTGPYAIVRHPMYMGVLIMCIGVPLALGSLWGLVTLTITLGVLIWRILDEEKLLKVELPGYSEYAQRVRYRLVPYLW